jgi:hypothetical protein
MTRNILVEICKLQIPSFYLESLEKEKEEEKDIYLNGNREDPLKVRAQKAQ